MVYIRSHTDVDRPPGRDPPEMRQLDGERKAEKVQAE